MTDSDVLTRPTSQADAMPPAGRRDLAPPPRILMVAAATVLTIGVAVAVLGAWRTGVSWDETYHVMRMRNFLEHGWYLLDGDLDPTLGNAPGAWEDQRYVYAPVAMGLLHGWSMLWGIDHPGTVSATDQAFAVRHLGVVLISLVGVAATAVIVRLLLRSWGWALVGAAVLVAVPTWTGHAMFNVKDVPVATGYTLVSLGVIVVIRADAARWLMAGAATTGAGLVLAVGTRPGIWPGLALAGGVGLLAVLVRRQWGRALVLLAAPAVALALLVVIYPEAFSTPVTALVEGALSSANFDGQQGSWFYLPLFLVIELPTLLACLGAAGAVIVVRRLVAAPSWTPQRIPDAAAWVVVLLQAFALPALAVARQSNLYTGLRQLLFAAPALAVLVTVTVAALWAWRVAAAQAGRARTRRRLVPALTIAALAVPLLVQVQLFPYSYAFSSVPANLLSPITARHDRDLEVQTDYWRTSVRELAPSVPSDGFVTCTPLIDAEERFLPRSSESREDCGVDLIGPLAPYDDLRSGGQAGAGGADPTRFLAVDAGSAFVGSNCDVLAQVARRLWWREVPMSTVASCDLVLEPLPDDGRVAFAGDGSGASFLRGTWRMNRALPGAGLDASSGLISFSLSASDQGRDLAITLTGTGLSGAEVAVDGQSVAVDSEDEGVQVGVPADVAAAYGQGRIVLTLSTITPGATRLTSLEVEAR
ncbi:hypothetical protein BH09ACT12_BH09ACT12_26130 [soil metagenome]